MSNQKQNKKTVVLSSLVIGLAGMVLMGVMKNKLLNVPFFKRLLQFKNVGLDSMKDFLEIAELNYRVFDSSLLGDLYKLDPSLNDGVRVAWDLDESTGYTIFVSAEPISKELLFNDSKIPLLRVDEVKDLQTKSNWIRRIQIGAIDQIKKTEKNMPWVELDQEDLPEEEVDPKIKDGRPLGSKTIVNTFNIPFNSFYSRLRSRNGRVSKEISHPSLRKKEEQIQEVRTTIFSRGRHHYLKITQNQLEHRSTIYDYQVVLYLSDGQGLRRLVPPFKESIEIRLGVVQPCLCYITGIREIGEPFEQYVGWIGEEKALTLDGELELYLDPTF